jgi:hypothetical protein
VIPALLIIHGVVAAALLGAVTHQALSVLRRSADRNGSFFDRYAAVRPPSFTAAIVILYVLNVGIGAVLYPSYRLNVRSPLEEMSLAWTIGLFELKEHFGGIGLGVLPLYVYTWRAVSRLPPARPRRAHGSAGVDRLVELHRRARGEQHPRVAMNGSRFPAPAFTVAFCCTYVVVFVKNWPLFLYYPLHGDLTWGWQVMNGAGPAMVWYGFMADAIIVGLAAALCVPRSALDGRLRNYLWLFPCAAMLICVYLVRQLFV